MCAVDARSEIDKLQGRVARLETLLRDYLMKRRELELNELAFIEDAVRVTRTIPRLKTIEDVDEQIRLLRIKRMHMETSDNQRSIIRVKK